MKSCEDMSFKLCLPPACPAPKTFGFSHKLYLSTVAKDRLTSSLAGSMLKYVRFNHLKPCKVLRNSSSISLTFDVSLKFRNDKTADEILE